MWAGHLVGEGTRGGGEGSVVDFYHALDRSTVLQYHSNETDQEKAEGVWVCLSVCLSVCGMCCCACTD